MKLDSVMATKRSELLWWAVLCNCKEKERGKRIPFVSSDCHCALWDFKARNSVLRGLFYMLLLCPLLLSHSQRGCIWKLFSLLILPLSSTYGSRLALVLSLLWGKKNHTPTLITDSLISLQKPHLIPGALLGCMLAGLSIFTYSQSPVRPYDFSGSFFMVS